MPASAFFRRRPVTAYFVLTFLVSWSAALAVAASNWARGQPVSKVSGILMFPAMILGPSVSGILLTRIVDGRDGVRDLLARMGRWRVALRWYALLSVPPVLVLTVLRGLTLCNSDAFRPNHFYSGILFGIPAGIFEEIGWMGYAFPKMKSRSSVFSAALVLGLLWGLWHLPVINFLGAAAPHGAYWFPFFLAFTFAMIAMRVLIAWMYRNTNSVLLAQFMHISSTGALVIFSPAVTPPQEAVWYTVYGALLWALVGVIFVLRGKPRRLEVRTT